MQVPWSGVTTNHSTSPFAEEMYEKIKDSLIGYEVVINRWPQYSVVLENVISNSLSFSLAVYVSELVCACAINFLTHI